MKRFDLLRTTTFLILAYGIFSGNSCFKTATGGEDSKCGPDLTWSHSFEPLSYQTATLDGTIREFYYEDLSTPESICSEEHVKVSYSIYLEDHIQTPPLNFACRGNAYWGGLYGRSTPLPWDPNAIFFHALDQIGLKQAFNGKPGYIGLQLFVRFPSKGDVLIDAHYLDSVVKRLDIEFYYKFSL